MPDGWVSDEDLKAMSDFFKTYKPKKDTSEWLTQGHSWRRYHAWGGDLAKIWIGKLDATEENLAADSPSDIGKRYYLRSMKIGTGINPGVADRASAYIRVPESQGNEVHPFLFTVWFDQDGFPEHTVKVNGKVYHLSLRLARTYKDYTMHLKEFRHDRYTGTNTARNFSSEVLLIDKDHPQGLPYRISMNDPLRYKGETFYQQGFQPGDTHTILQIVRNPSYLLPYVACIMVALGLMFHFGQTLRKFIHKQKASS